MGLAVVAWSGTAPAQEAAGPKITQTEQRARELLKLDATAGYAFIKEHPGVLPELQRKLPKPKAKAFDWVDHNGVGLAHEQKAADCWANAVTEALECSWLIRNGTRVYLSPQPLLDRTQNLNEKGFSVGNNLRRPCDLLLKHGTARFGMYPYTGKPDQYNHDVKMSHRIVAWGSPSPEGKPPTVPQLKEALLHHGPLAISIYSTESFRKFRGSGVFAEDLKLPENKPKSNHLLLLVGWDDRKGKHGAWRVRNSWRPSWGDNGYAWIEYGSNYVAYGAVWVTAQSTYYPLPPGEFSRLVPDGDPLPRWKSPLQAAREKR
jgi:cathepsin L